MYLKAETVIIVIIIIEILIMMMMMIIIIIIIIIKIIISRSTNNNKTSVNRQAHTGRPFVVCHCLCVCMYVRCQWRLESFQVRQPLLLLLC